MSMDASSSADRFARTRLLLGDEALARLARASVTVVGLGAVGSYAVEGLARSGIGRLRLADFDTVHPSNVNRQLYALGSTFGHRKVDVARTRVRDINPDCRVEGLHLFVNRDTVDRVLDPPPDLLLDAIDSLGPKVGLLAAAVTRGIPVLSSMGAALRRDPSRIHLASLCATTGCPLARFIRRRLRRAGVDPAAVTCVFSDEPVPRGVPAAPPDDSEAGSAGRPRRPLGSTSTITAMFGLWLATEAIRRLCGDDPGCQG